MNMSVTVVASADAYMGDNILSALHFAGDLLSDPSRRCVGTLAQNAQGMPTNPQEEEACRWDLSGALGKACLELGISDPKTQIDVYVTAKDKIGIPGDIAAPVFWDMNENLHDLIAGRLRKAE